MSYRIVCLEDLKIPYLICKKHVKRLSVKYNSNAVLVIVQPVNVDDILVIKFIEEHLDWILNHKPVKPLAHEEYHDGDSYLLLGKEYLIQIVYSNYETVILKQDKIIIYTVSKKRVENLLEKFRYEQAELVFNEMLYKCFTNMSEHLIKYPKLTIKKSRSRWGCCYINENRIMLNISLIHVPHSLIEYVIFHELVHFVYPNHSKEFHNLLKKYVYDEKNKQKNLKKYNIIYK